MRAQKIIGSVYQPNIDKIAQEFGNARRMCKEINMPYQSYQAILRLPKKRICFHKDSTRDGFYRLLNEGYIEYVGERQ